MEVKKRAKNRPRSAGGKGVKPLKHGMDDKNVSVRLTK